MITCDNPTRGRKRKDRKRSKERYIPLKLRVNITASSSKMIHAKYLLLMLVT